MAALAHHRFVPSFNPYDYTQGRWLDRDLERREARQLHFDFDALLDAAIKSSKGARQVIGCEKKEGGFNRVFVIKLDTGAKVIARLPTGAAGPPALTVSSEVATLKYVGEKTSVPVPEVLSWNTERKTDPVGAEYMIMNAVSGVPLNEIWSQMTSLQHIECIESIGKVAKELCTLDFAAYGSIYLNKPHKPSETLPLNEDYCIGPHCARQHWGYDGVGNKRSSNVPTGCQGPWKNLEAYFADQVRIAEATIAHNNAQTETINEHLRLLEFYTSALKILLKADNVQDSSMPTLFHPDFDARNIFVSMDDPTKITGVIDWQSTAIEPALTFAVTVPDFAEELSHDKTLDASLDAEPSDVQADAHRCAHTWTALTHSYPKLGTAARLNPLLCHFLAAASSGRIDEEVHIRSLLTDMDQYWSALGLPGRSPYRPSPEDLKCLEQSLDELETTQRLRVYLTRLLRCESDGWVNGDKWEEILPKYRMEYEEFIRACVTSREKGEDEAVAISKGQRIWPFDQR